MSSRPWRARPGSFGLRGRASDGSLDVCVEPDRLHEAALDPAVSCAAVLDTSAAVPIDGLALPRG